MPSLSKVNEAKIAEFASGLDDKEYRARTIKTYTRFLERFFAYADCSYSDMNPEKMEKALMAMKRDSNLGAQSIKQALSALKTFYGRFLKMPAALAVLDDMRGGKKNEIPKILTPTELNDVLKFVIENEGIQWYAMTNLTYSAGLRVFELIALTPKDISLKSGEVQIREGKGGKEATIKIPESTCETIRQYMQSDKFEDKQPYLFMYNSGVDGTYRQFYVWKIEKKWHEILIACGIIDKQGWHILRHSIASHLLQMGWTLQEVKTFMRHSSIKTTSIYLHTFTNPIKEKGHPMDKLVGL